MIFQTVSGRFRQVNPQTPSADLNVELAEAGLNRRSRKRQEELTHAFDVPLAKTATEMSSQVCRQTLNQFFCGLFVLVSLQTSENQPCQRRAGMSVMVVSRNAGFQRSGSRPGGVVKGVAWGH